MMTRRQSDARDFAVLAAIILTLYLMVRMCEGAEVPARAPASELVAIELAEGESAQVVRVNDGRLAVVPSRTFGQTMVFAGRAGWYTVLVTPLKLHEIELYDTEPAPGPAPPPGPVPVPPNQYGVGRVAYDAGVSLRDPASAAIIAEVFAAGAGRMAGLSGDVVDDATTANEWIRKEIDRRVTGAAWTPWRATVAEAMRAAWRAGHTTREAYAGVLDEIATAAGMLAK